MTLNASDIVELKGQIADAKLNGLQIMAVSTETLDSLLNSVLEGKSFDWPQFITPRRLAQLAKAKKSKTKNEG